MSNFTYITIASIIIGLAASWRRYGWRTVILTIAAFAGSFVGLFVAFGDVPLFRKFSVLLNERTVPVLFAVCCIFIVLLVEKRVRAKA